MGKNEIILEFLEDELFRLDNQWKEWPLNLSIPKQIYEIKEEINNLLTNKK